MTNNKQLSIIDALCIVKTGSRTEQERELLDHAYLVINNIQKYYILSIKENALMRN